ncbi:MAG: protein kinase [Acidobacteriaceae bacterium]|nr:protein kinase [Acidobacteriaceae bacterium]
MDSERWKQVERIYHSVLACPPESRAAVLEASCGNNPSLREELESLLSAREEAGDFLSPGGLQEYLGKLADPPEPTLIGRTLDHYEVTGELGSGAMAVVYGARDTRLDRPVALKILPARFTHNTERVARFRREAKAASALNHPNIVTIYDIGQDGERWFIAAELVEGVSLRNYLSRRRLSYKETLGIAVQCAAALQAAHRSGVVHRDIKPENIMIRPDGAVKVVDFGLASISENGQGPAAQLSASGSIMGTPRYMSPEQARGQKLDARTDIFSLGAVIYEMATNQPAFPGANAAEVFAALLGEADPVARGTPFGKPFDRILRKALARDREARYQTAEELANDLRSVATKTSDSRFAITAPGPRKHYAAVGLVALLAAAATVILWSRHTRQHLLTEQGTILLTDFRNQTGDPVFEPTLKEGLAVQLEQSPFLTILPDARVRDTLRLMKRQPGEPITPEIGREICLRQGLRAMITGSIASLGRHYVLALEAIDSHSSTTLARTQTEAQSKEDVLKALSRGAKQLREKLGESLGSIQKYDALLERTTSSLEALQAYSLGYQERRRGRPREAIRLWLKAVELDPGFAYAYSDLATAYRNTRHTTTAAQYAAKAYALRDRVSERERLRITSLYYEYVTGEIDKNIETLKLYQQIYPRDPLPHNNLSVSYAALGQYQPAFEESRLAMLLDSDAAARFSTQASYLVHLNRYGEAKSLCERAVREKRDGTSVHRELYLIAFVAGDTSAMEQQLAWAAGNAEEYAGFHWRAGAAVYRGQWRLSSEYARRAVDIAEKKGDSELAALYTSEFASRAAVLGKCEETRSAVRKTLSMEGTQQSLMLAGLALELCGETGEPQALELTRQYPKSQIVLSVRLPVLRAAADLKRGNAASATEALKPAEDYEAAAEFWPQFLRGQIYLRQGKGNESAGEFNKVLDHRGQAIDSVLYPLANLGAARAAMLSGDAVKARRLYQAFFTEWKGADTDLAPLLAAQKEFSRLP